LFCVLTKKGENFEDAECHWRSHKWLEFVEEAPVTRDPSEHHRLLLRNVVEFQHSKLSILSFVVVATDSPTSD
jgi:hypothetical protein